MDSGGSRVGPRASDDARRLPIDQVVTRLRAVLGARLVAYIGEVNATSIVRNWADGSAVPDAARDTRLRTALHVMGIPEEGCDPVTIGTWFQGMNPILGDQSPARVIRQSLPGDDQEVLVAARSMLIS